MRAALVHIPALALSLVFSLLMASAFGQGTGNTADPAFDILQFLVEGNTVLSNREIERALTPFLGEKRHFSDIEAARQALEDAYQKSGFQSVFVEIPEQKVVAGTIRLHALEGRVGNSRVSGARYYEMGQIRAGAPQLAAGNVPDFNQLQQDMASLNKLPDRQVVPILTAGKVPGTIDVNLSVKDSVPLHGDIEDDNHASPFTTANRTSASLHYDDLWQMGHSVAINYQVAPAAPAQTNVLYATYLWRFAGVDDALSVYGIRSNSDVAVVGGSTVLGNAKIAGARWIHPLGSGLNDSVNYFHALTLGIDRKDFAQTNVSVLTDNLDVLPSITYYPLSISYALTLVRDAGNVQFSLGFVTAPRDLFGNTDEKFRSRRVVGDASYMVWKPGVSGELWLGKRWSAFGNLDGQWTNDPLIPNEQYVTGGADSVRGYRESEVSGDRGARATAELRFYPLGRPELDGKRLLYTEAFFDSAQVRLVDPQGPQISVFTIASTGFGLHAQGWHGLHGAIDFAATLRDGGHAVSGAITPNGTRRVEAGLGYTF
jgi:hemolysin activation/secretion protein